MTREPTLEVGSTEVVVQAPDQIVQEVEDLDEFSEIPAYEVKSLWRKLHGLFSGNESKTVAALEAIAEKETRSLSSVLSALEAQSEKLKELSILTKQVADLSRQVVEQEHVVQRLTSELKARPVAVTPPVKLVTVSVPVEPEASPVAPPPTIILRRVVDAEGRVIVDEKHRVALEDEKVKGPTLTSEDKPLVLKESPKMQVKPKGYSYPKDLAPGLYYIGEVADFEKSQVRVACPHGTPGVFYLGKSEDFPQGQSQTLAAPSSPDLGKSSGQKEKSSVTVSASSSVEQDSPSVKKKGKSKAKPQSSKG